MDEPSRAKSPRRLTTAAVLALAFACYLAMAVVLFWHAWTTHPTNVTLCGCEDPSLTTWFLEWPAYALSHGHNPLYSSALFHPVGINLLSNTGMLAIAVPLAPVTLAFGPVASLNVALTIGPALSGLAMFWLLLRFVEFKPAGFVGGAIFGFCPFVFSNLAVAHLNLGYLMVVPLVVGALDELCFAQRHSPVVAGSVLGLLVVVQFFLSTEILTIMVLCGVPTMVVVIGYLAVRRRDELRRRARHALVGLGVAVSVAAVLLAYPVWFTLDGPAHMSGVIWPSLPPGGIGISDIWRLQYVSAASDRFFAGYQGNHGLVEQDYLGTGALVVVAAGLLLGWRNRRVWLLTLLGAISFGLSVGIVDHEWTPWRPFAYMPLVQNVLPIRITSITTLCVAGVVAITMDRVFKLVRAATGRLAARARADAPAHRRRPSLLPAAVAGLVVVAIGALAVVPMVSAEAVDIPLTTEPVALPAWFELVAPHLGPDQVLLTFPSPAVGGSAMTWQAVDSLSFTMATGGGPQSIPSRAGKERRGLVIMTNAASLFVKLAPASAENVAAVRRALAGWGVTTVVMPEPGSLVPRYSRSASTAWALGFFTLAIGRPPSLVDGSWVWSSVRSAPGRRSITRASFSRCTTPHAEPGRYDLAIPACVMRASSALS